jgi:ferredoxin
VTANPIADSQPGDEEFVVVLNDGRRISIEPDLSILETLRNAGLELDSSCEAGSCGTCEVAVLDGVPDHRDLILDEDERAANDAMMICVSRSQTPELRLDL